MSSNRKPFDLVTEGITEWDAGNVARAEALLVEGVSAYRTMEPDGVDFALGRLGAFLLQQGRVNDARGVLEEAITANTDIPAIWWDYMAVLAAADDVDGLAGVAASARKALTGGPSAAELMLQLARRADREKHPRRAENIARRAVADATSSGDRAGRWAAVGELGRIVEKRGLDDEARTMWKEAFAEGSPDPVTAARYSMALEKGKEYQEAVVVLREALARALPANVDEQLRKRLVRCEAKISPGKTKTADVPAFTVRVGAGVISNTFQVRLQPPLRHIAITGSAVRCLGRKGDTSTLVEFAADSGIEVRRTENLPPMDSVWFSTDGWGLGTQRTGRVGDGVTELYFFSPEGLIVATGQIADALSEVADGSTGLWFVGCRDGNLYAFARSGALRWTWSTPGSRNHDGDVYLRPCPYYVTAVGSGAVIASMGQLFGIDSSGKTTWRVALPNEEQTSYTFSVGGRGAALSGTEAYRTLGIPPHSDHSAVKTAYRRLALATHPDHNPDDPTTATRFMAVQSAYEAIVSGVTDRSREGTTTLSVQFFGMEPLVSALAGGPLGVAAGSSQGRLYVIGVSGVIRQVRALGRSHVRPLLRADGTIAAAWCEGALSFFHGDSVVNAAEIPEPPMGMTYLGSDILHWRRNRVELTDSLGRVLWIVDFSKNIAGLAAVGNDIVCGAGVLTGFRRTL
jgi:tetratricopeptide (TPR) repeat protein